MSERITLALEEVGAGILWLVLGFTLLVFTAHWSWIGESAADLRWHVGIAGLLPALPGLFFLRKRTIFGVLAAVSLLNLSPGLAVYVPPGDAEFDGGTSVQAVLSRWDGGSTANLEDYLRDQPAEVVVLTGLQPSTRDAILLATIDWPYTLAVPDAESAAWLGTLGVEGEGLDLEQSPTSMLVLSRLPLEEPRVDTVEGGGVLVEVQLDVPGPVFVLRAAMLPDAGPGEASAAREALLDELARREWTIRSTLLVDLGASDTSPSYARLLDTTGLVDSRRGIGRMATGPAELMGFELPLLHMPSEFILVGAEAAVEGRWNQALVAHERGRPDLGGPTHHVARASLRIRD